MVLCDDPDSVRRQETALCEAVSYELCESVMDGQQIRETELMGLGTPSQSRDFDDCLLIKGVENRDIDCVSEWVLGRLDHFGFFLRCSFEGVEDEAKDLFRLIERRRLRRDLVGSKSIDCKRLRNELKQLVCGIN